MQRFISTPPKQKRLTGTQRLKEARKQSFIITTLPPMFAAQLDAVKELLLGYPVTWAGKRTLKYSFDDVKVIETVLKTITKGLR